MPAAINETEIVRVKEGYSHWLFDGNCLCQRLYLSFTPILCVMTIFATLFSSLLKFDHCVLSGWEGTKQILVTRTRFLKKI